VSSSSKIKTNYRASDGRLRGLSSMPEPDDFFNKPFQYTATFDTPLMQLGERPATPSGELVRKDESDPPVPEDCSNISQEKSPYRSEVKASLSAELAAVVKFYRRELGSAKWQEDAARSKVSADSANLVFRRTGEDLQLRLGRNGDDTTIELVMRNAKLAEANNLLPPAGKARLVLGNASEKAAVFMVDGKDYKTTDASSPDDLAKATRIDLPPGKHSVSVKIDGAQRENENVELEAGSTWGIIALPEGHIATRMF
jgi:hypothetical protein